MKNRIKKLNLLLTALVLLVSVIGCSGASADEQLQTDYHFVELGGAKSATIEVDLNIGGLELMGGADELVEADFVYQGIAYKPELTETRSGDSASVVIHQQEEANFFNQDKAETMVRLNNDVPVDLTIKLGTDSNYIKADGLTLNSLYIEGGSGELCLDMSGDWDYGLDVTVNDGTGNVTVIVPNGTHTVVDTSGSIGEVINNGLHKEGRLYMNDSYDVSEAVLIIRVHGEISAMTLKLSDE